MKSNLEKIKNLLNDHSKDFKGAWAPSKVIEFEKAQGSDPEYLDVLSKIPKGYYYLGNIYTLDDMGNFDSSKLPGSSELEFTRKIIDITVLKSYRSSDRLEGLLLTEYRTPYGMMLILEHEGLNVEPPKYFGDTDFIEHMMYDKYYISAREVNPNEWCLKQSDGSRNSSEVIFEVSFQGLRCIIPEGLLSSFKLNGSIEDVKSLIYRNN